MCGRYVLKEPLDLLQRIFRYSSSEIRQLPARYNIAPTTRIPVVRCRRSTGERKLEEMRWGLIPSWAKDLKSLPLMNNARSETVATKPAFRAAFKSRRCLIPASGYYEWQKRPDGTKQPFYIHRADGQPLAFAGLWEASSTTGDAHLRSATIITTEANPKLAPIHNRMTVTLDEADRDLWMSQEPLSPMDLERLFSPAHDEGLTTDAISTRVNSVRNDHADLLNPL
jgi:putative SOS response-associated peptidase YedK